MCVQFSWRAFSLWRTLHVCGCRSVADGQWDACLRACADWRVQVLFHVSLDWTAAGAAARRSVHGPLLRLLDAAFPSAGQRSADVRPGESVGGNARGGGGGGDASTPAGAGRARVLVPGCGTARSTCHLELLLFPAHARAHVSPPTHHHSSTHPLPPTHNDHTHPPTPTHTYTQVGVHTGGERI